MQKAYDNCIINGVKVFIVPTELYYIIRFNDGEDYAWLDYFGIIVSTSLEEYHLSKDKVYIPKYDLTIELKNDGIYLKSGTEEWVLTAFFEPELIEDLSDVYNK